MGSAGLAQTRYICLSGLVKTIPNRVKIGHGSAKNATLDDDGLGLDNMPSVNDLIRVARHLVSTVWLACCTLARLPMVEVACDWL